MRERGILYSSPMVRAKLAGIKTQTRRIIKRQPPDCGKIKVGMFCPTFIDTKGEEYAGPEHFGAFSDCGEWGTACPFGKVGDRLWARESFAYTVGPRGKVVLVYRADNAARYALAEDEGEGDLCGLGNICADFEPPTTRVWKPSIHMFRWASRILDEIVEIRVERVQDISEEDAIAEGIERDGVEFGVPGMEETYAAHSARGAYAKLWNSINGKGSWESNPWVWVIVTKAVQP